MKEVIRKHVQYELTCLGENRNSVKEINQMIKEGEYTPTREYLSMLKRVVKIQAALLGCDGELKQVFVLRYKKGMSWVAIAFAMNVSEATVKRYNHKLLEAVAMSLGWI